MEGGIILHCPSGKRKVCPISDDQEAVASAIGGLVTEILIDRNEPEAEEERTQAASPAVVDAEVVDGYDFDEEDEEEEHADAEEEEEERPRRRRKKKRRKKKSAGSAMGGVNYKPREGETADGYVDRVGKEAGFNLLRAGLRGLQRMSGTKVED